MSTFNFPHVVLDKGDYRRERVPRYSGNPFVEALPSLPTDTELQNALTNLPPFDARERSMPAEDRIQLLDTLQTLFVPLPRHVRLARGVLKMVRTGYGPRKPFSVEDNSTLQRLHKLQSTGSFVSLKQTDLASQHSMSLVGASGCGKSFSLRQIAGLFAPAIYHSDSGKWQLPFLFVEMSYDGESVHSLASGLFQELDRLLPGENYTHMYMERKKFNAQQRLAKALSIAYEHGAGMVVVDEQQNQRHIGNDDSQKRVKRTNAATNIPRNETPLTKLLITASNTSHIPLLFAGTLEMKNVLGARFTRSRRMGGRGSAVWQPLEPSFDLHEDGLGEFEFLLMALWQYQWIRKPVKLDENWLGLFWDLTQGIPDIMVKLFESSQEAAIASGLETLKPSLVQEVFDREFAMAAFGIQALRENDSVLQDAVPDLYNKDLPRKRNARADNRRSTMVAVPAVVPPAYAAPKTTRPGPKPIAIPIDVLKGADLRTALLNGASPVGAVRKEGSAK